MRKQYVIAMALIALAGVFSGGAIAANSFSGRDIRNSSLTGADIRNSSLTGADIRNGSLTEQELSRRVRFKLNSSTPSDPRPGPQGPQGPQGLPGPQGPPGPSNVGQIITVVGPENSVAAGDAGSSTAACPAGTRAISGGGFFITGDGNGISASEASSDRTSWFVVGGNTSVVSGSTQAVAYCAPVGQAVAAGRRRGQITPRARRQVARLEAMVARTIR